MIDLDAYLNRIGYTGPRAASYEVLSAVARLQPAGIVYENIDPLLGTAPLLNLGALQDKLLTRGRGGYCFEQNLLLKEALQALGMKVTALAARVVWMQPPGAPLRSRNHMVLRVEAAGGQAGPFIVDAGFGGNLMNTPLAWEPGVVQRSPHAVLRLTQDGEWYTIETMLPTGWAAMYRFTLEPYLPVDYEPLNWFTATHHSSIFRHNLLMERLTPELRTGLFNDRLVLRRPGGAPQVRRIDTLAGFDEVLRDHFGLQLPATLVDQLYERVPKGLDQFVVPPA
ncbi:MAG: arylamine N-acetyltransferase [Rhizobacter sp.]|nr:arylamine N-acetyltransferase [Rhizobacter sp.]